MKKRSCKIRFRRALKTGRSIGISWYHDSIRLDWTERKREIRKKTTGRANKWEDTEIEELCLLYSPTIQTRTRTLPYTSSTDSTIRTHQHDVRQLQIQQDMEMATGVHGADGPRAGRHSSRTRALRHRTTGSLSHQALAGRCRQRLQLESDTSSVCVCESPAYTQDAVCVD